ncbi:MAG: EscU/YscU/HrcU family type III secretion system export apparatus switch protein [Thermodesulfobacteriota bacterium]|jgi:flagellar biosynthesis protein
MLKDPKENKKPVQKAVALRYIPTLDRAPKVTAKGSGLLAQKIIELAREHGIPIQEDPVLIQILSQLDFYQEIPPTIYVVVAEILAFVYSVNNRWRGDQDRK